MKLMAVNVASAAAHSYNFLHRKCEIKKLSFNEMLKLKIQMDDSKTAMVSFTIA